MDIVDDQPALLPQAETDDNSASGLLPHPGQLGLSGDIQALTKGLQAHFETLLAENQRMKQERDEARQQLTHLMYLRDGATRVVGRQIDEINLLKRQIDDLTAALDQARQHRDANGHDGTMTDEDNIAGVTAAYKEALERFNSLSRDLLQNRKQRTIVARTGTDLANYQVLPPATAADGKSRRLATGVICFTNLISGLRASADDGGVPFTKVPDMYAVGHKNGTVSVHSWRAAQEAPLASLCGHEGAVTCLDSLVYPCLSHLRPSALAALNASSSSPAPFKSVLNIFSGGADGTVRIWTEQNLKTMDVCHEQEFLRDVSVKAAGGSVEYIQGDAPKFKSLDFVCDHVFRLGQSATKSGTTDQISISALKLHPAGTHLAIATNNVEAGWALADLTSRRIVKRFADSKYKCRDLAFQPDGNVIVGIDPSARVLPVWDFRSPEMKAAPTASDITGELTCIDFSESGYHIVTTSSCGKAQLWDLRRVEVIQEYDLGETINKARFDFSGRHILFAGKFGTILYSTQEKKKLAQVAAWDSGINILDAQFDHVSDDYFFTLGEDGLETIMNSYAIAPSDS